MSELEVVAAVVLVSVVTSVLALVSRALVTASKCSTLICTWAGALEVRGEPGMRGSLSDTISPSSKHLSLKRTVGVMPLVLSCLHALRLCFLLTLFVQPDRFYRLPDSLRTLPLSRYLAALVSTRLTMLTFLFRLCFSRSRCLCLLSLFS